MLAFLLAAYKKEQTFYGQLYDAPAYDFELTSHDGKRVKLSDYLREKVIVLLFFGYTFGLMGNLKKIAEDIKYLLKNF